MRRARVLHEKRHWETPEQADERITREDAENAERMQQIIAAARRRIAAHQAELDARAAPARAEALRRQAEEVATSMGRTRTRAAQAAAREAAARRRAERQAARERRRLWRRWW